MSNGHSFDKNMSILIINDFTTVRRIIRNCLKQLGFDNITESEDGSDALSKLNQTDFQFVISDWNMPNMLGADFLETIQQDQRLKTIPLLFVASEGQKATLSKQGIESYIVKPFTAEVLKHKMTQLFNNKA